MRNPKKRNGRTQTPKKVNFLFLRRGVGSCWLGRQDCSRTIADASNDDSWERVACRKGHAQRTEELGLRGVDAVIQRLFASSQDKVEEDSPSNSEGEDDGEPV